MHYVKISRSHCTISIFLVQLPHPMALRTIYLISSRDADAQRARFAIFVPSDAQPDRGTLIQAVGAPMTGYILEFKRNHSPAEESAESYTVIPIGRVDPANIVDSVTEEKSVDSIPQGNIEIAASQIPTPGISENFLAPVNDVRSQKPQAYFDSSTDYMWELDLQQKMPGVDDGICSTSRRSTPHRIRCNSDSPVKTRPAKSWDQITASWAELECFVPRTWRKPDRIPVLSEMSRYSGDWVCPARFFDLRPELV